jgi:hypothetical protein
MKLRSIVLVTGLLALAGVGCASSQDTATQGSASPASGAPATENVAALPTSTSDPACADVPAALEGRWTMTLRPKDLPPELFDMDTGVFVMTLGPGHYVRTDVDSDHRGGDGELCWTAGDRMSFPPRGECAGNSPGVYAWALHDDALTFTAVADDCFPRPFSLTFSPWTRVPD